MKKLFAGIHSVQFDDGNQHITTMNSVDGEQVKLKTPVKIQPEVEVKNFTGPEQKLVICLLFSSIMVQNVSFSLIYFTSENLMLH